MEHLSVEELKLRIELRKKQLEEKNVSIGKLRNQLLTLQSQVPVQQEEQYLQAQARCDSLQRSIDEVDAESERTKRHFEAVFLEKEAKISRLRNEIAALEVEQTTEQPSFNLSFNNTTIEQEETELDIKKKLLENLRKQCEDLHNQEKVLQDELDLISNEDNKVKAELSEAYELKAAVEMEAATLRNTLNDGWTGTKEKSLFDEVNDPREELIKKLQALKNYHNDLQMQMDEQKKTLIQLCNLKFKLKEVIEKHPIECMQDLDTISFNYNVYIKNLRDLCNRLGKLLTERDETIEKWLSGDAADFYTKLCKQHQKYKEEADEHTAAEYTVMKLKSTFVREKCLEIIQEEREMKRLLNAMQEKRSRDFRNESVKTTVEVAIEDEAKVENQIEKVPRDNVTKRRNKKVEFQVEEGPSSDGPARRGGKVLEYKTVFIRSKFKKK